MLLLVLTGLSWMLQVMSMMKFLLNYGIDLTNFVGLTALMIPFIVSIIIPFVAFIAVIFVYNKMIGDNEITVLAASGLSPGQIAKPALSMAIILAILHWILNIWVVPMTQAKFYDTQWELRYGLAHMKIQESAFTQMANDLVVYVDKVSGYDLSQVMLYDKRDPQSEKAIFAEKGKLITTTRGLTIAMTNGALQSRDESLTVGTFESFDMDLNVADKAGESVFKIRRISTLELLQTVTKQTEERHHKLALSEICSRLLGPIMNLILVTLCLVILLRSSLLRRRASMSPIIAVGVMAMTMALFMSVSNMTSSLTDVALVGVMQMVILMGALAFLFKK